MKLNYLSIVIISIELWKIVNSAVARPPPAKHFIDNNGRISGDGGATGFNWPDCIIPYFIDPSSYNYNMQQKILQVMEEQYHQKTCIRFRPWQQNDRNWIEIKHQNPGCSALVGMQRYGGQIVNLAPNCIYDVIITHELMHAVGFNHQHIAYNRDDYIVIHWENIMENQKYNFIKENPADNQDGQYGFDFTSAMMYGRLAFSKNNQPVMDAKPPYIFDKDLYGNDYGLVEKDILKIRLRYQNVCSCYSNSWNSLTNNTTPQIRPETNNNNNNNNNAVTTMIEKLPFKKLPVKVPVKFPF